jgi:hypothetical protein
MPMPEIHLDAETIDRLDSLRVDDESYDEIVTELLDIYEAEELTLQFGGDKLP